MFFEKSLRFLLTERKRSLFDHEFVVFFSPPARNQWSSVPESLRFGSNHQGLTEFFLSPKVGSNAKDIEPQTGGHLPPY